MTHHHLFDQAIDFPLAASLSSAAVPNVTAIPAYHVLVEAWMELQAAADHPQQVAAASRLRNQISSRLAPLANGLLTFVNERISTIPG
jgi:hypothetical protein